MVGVNVGVLVGVGVVVIAGVGVGVTTGGIGPYGFPNWVIIEYTPSDDFFQFTSLDA